MAINTLEYAKNFQQSLDKQMLVGATSGWMESNAQNVKYSGGDTVRLNHARLRPKASDEEIENASYKLFLVDTDTGRAINCWQILVTSFNGIKTYV